MIIGFAWFAACLGSLLIWFLLVCCWLFAVWCLVGLHGCSLAVLCLFTLLICFAGLFMGCVCFTIELNDCVLFVRCVGLVLFVLCLYRLLLLETSLNCIDVIANCFDLGCVI